VARAPLIFSVGIRSKDGAMLAACSNFYNVRVRYERKETQKSEGGSQKSKTAELFTSAFRLPPSAFPEGSEP
jgi:hypothetical protein